MIAVEVIAKLGDSIIEIARIERNGSYTCPLVAFPLVCGDPAGFVVHRPIGVTAWRRGVLCEDTKVMVRPDDAIVIAVGHVTLYVLPILERAALVPKASVELRPFAYAAVVFVAHLFVWGLAEARYTPPLERLPAPQPMHRVHVARLEPPPLPAPPRVSVAETPTRASGTATKKGRARTKRESGSRSGQGAFVAAFGDVSMLIPSVDVAGW